MSFLPGRHGGGHASSAASLAWQGLGGNYDFSLIENHKEDKSEVLEKAAPSTHGSTGVVKYEMMYSVFYFVSFAVSM